MRVVDTDELLWGGAHAQARALRSRELSAPELLTAVLARLAAVQPALNAFRVVCASEAADAAVAAQRRLDAGEDAPLLGVPIAIKDDTDLAGHTTCYGADPSVRQPAERDGEMVRRLRAAGAVIVGKTHVPELTIWPFTETLHHGATRNPWAPDRTPGGSSGGSAAAVAAGVVGVAHGSDGAGSIRIPSAWCGLIGLKPTRGLVPTEGELATPTNTTEGELATPTHATEGEHATPTNTTEGELATPTVVAAASNWYRLTHFGPLARDVASAARFMDACATPTGGGGGSAGYLAALDEPVRPLRVAVSRHSPPGTVPGLRRAQRAAFERAAVLLCDAGHQVRELDPDVPLAATEHVLARYLRGIHDSARAVPAGTRLERRTRGVVRLGGLVPAAAVRASLRAEPALARRVLAVFDEVDVVLQPGPSSPPSRIGAYARAGALRSLAAAIVKVPFLPLWNLIGNPVLAAPVDVGPDGLPAGVQLIGPPGGERILLRLALQLERATGSAARRPVEVTNAR